MSTPQAHAGRMQGDDEDTVMDREALDEVSTQHLLQITAAVEGTATALDELCDDALLSVDLDSAADAAAANIMPPKGPKPTAGGRRKQAQPVTWKPRQAAARPRPTQAAEDTVTWHSELGLVGRLRGGDEPATSSHYTQCPLCQDHFPTFFIQTHARECTPTTRQTEFARHHDEQARHLAEERRIKAAGFTGHHSSDAAELCDDALLSVDLDSAAADAAAAARGR